MDDFPHLAGFQYLQDLSLPRYNAAKIADKILEGKIKHKQIIKGTKYEEMVQPRLEALAHLEEILNNDFLLFSFMPDKYPFATRIKADYIILNNSEPVSFVFIIQDSSFTSSKCEYLCCSAFKKGDRDYRVNQRPRTILKKERVHIPTNTNLIIMDNLTK